MKKVVYVTGSRADYGIVRNYIKKLDSDRDIKFSLLVTGSILEIGNSEILELIKNDAFLIDKEIPIDVDTESNGTIIHSMSLALDAFGKHFEENKYDLVIILGDRYEMMSVATAAAIQNLAILHIHGGEITYGNYDEFIRHSITKMSKYYFTSTEVYRNRVIQMGEDPSRVCDLGSLGAENCLNIDVSNVSKNIFELRDENYFVVIFHPETLTDRHPQDQLQALFHSLLEFIEDYEFYFIGSNADTYANFINNAIKDKARLNRNIHFINNLHPDAYHFLLKHAIALIGNSSSGIIEAPTLQTLTINIGLRQCGRLQGNSIFNCNSNTDDIIQSIRNVLKKDPLSVDFINPYFKKNAADQYYKMTKIILSELTNHSKKFYDIS